MKKFIGITGTAVLMFFSYYLPANADFNFGALLRVGEYETSGTETEKAVTGVTSGTETATETEGFYGASVFIEYEMDNGFALGLDYIPMDVDIGDGARTDSSSAANVASEADVGARTASASLDSLTTIYAHVPIGPIYALLGYHDTTVTTNESLPTSKYADVDLNGIMYGVGYKGENFRMELAYSDFDDIAITATGNTVSGAITGQNKVTADADALELRLGYAF